MPRKKRVRQPEPRYDLAARSFREETTREIVQTGPACFGKGDGLAPAVCVTANFSHWHNLWSIEAQVQGDGRYFVRFAPDEPFREPVNHFAAGGK